MDKLDALRNRHKSLPATDPDFTQPLAGATQVLYSDVEKDLNGLWDRWLHIMEVWEQAQKLVRAGSGLAIVKTEEAKKLIEQEGDFEELHRHYASCEERLDRLNHAHENAQAALKSARDELAKLHTTLGDITAAQLPIEPYTKEITIAEGLLTQAERLLPADPIGASEVIAHSREVLKVTADCAGQTLARFGDARSVLTAINEVAAQTAELRSQALKLTEDQADPDPRLDEARRRQSLAMESLKKANPAAASKQIDEARSWIDQVRQGIGRHLQARDAVRKELPARHEAARALGQAGDQTAAILEELRRGFAPESWSDVADDLDQARRCSGRSRRGSPGPIRTPRTENRTTSERPPRSPRSRATRPGSISCSARSPIAGASSPPWLASLATWPPGSVTRSIGPRCSFARMTAPSGRRSAARSTTANRPTET